MVSVLSLRIKILMQYQGNLHPGTRIIIALCFTAVVSFLSLQYQAFAVLLGAISAWVISKPLSSNDPGKAFLKIWLVAGFFLFLMHGLHYTDKIYIDYDALRIAGNSFLRIGTFIVVFLWLIRTIAPEELYALFVDLRLPMPVIYVIMKTLSLIPHFEERAKDILTAQQTRGFMLKGLRNRAKALFLIFPPLFASMLYELEESAASLSARGLHAKGRKTHLCSIKIHSHDVLIGGGCLLITLLFHIYAW